MIKFFNTLQSMHQFTLSLDAHSDKLQCQHCFKNDQFVSHGFIYKKRHQSDKQAVGKRIFCSNRFNRTGCGSTWQLYLSQEIPFLHYSTLELFAFLCSLMASLSIQSAYEQATGTEDPRNAYRWLCRLQNKLVDYRCLLNTRTPPGIPIVQSRCKRFQQLLPTLQSLFQLMKEPPCANYQNLNQNHFI